MPIEHSKPAHRHTECDMQNLSHSDVGSVQLCAHCGVVHVNLNYLSVKFTLEAFRELACMLVCAQGRIDAQPSDASLQTGATGDATALH